MTGTGRQYNEPNETLWSYLAPLGSATQYMQHRRRWGVLERAAQLYNVRQADRIVTLLQSMAAAAQQTLQLAARGQQDVLQQLWDFHNIDEEEVRRFPA